LSASASARLCQWMFTELRLGETTNEGLQRYPMHTTCALFVNEFQSANGELTLGRFQSVIFAEFDGPRKREITVHVIGE
jgi:hypothetical protein